MDIGVIIESHEQRLKTLERDMSAMKEVQGEIRSMNETLVTLANELKHTNEHLARHERKIDEIDSKAANAADRYGDYRGFGGWSDFCYYWNDACLRKEKI